ncbi:DUF6678 family protein [Gottfriedia luciferensis]|uniref:DUF6678 family protein n=1 Tax=Gottfriedia luciferensis TaxID=178774 RepID=UPI000B44F937|nr:DUF6678 family protein [Gottfriedia luciferensis]
MEDKQKVQTIITSKQLSSVMNNTKWEKLYNAILESLPLPPAYQVKYVTEDTLFPENFEDLWTWGDWKQGLRPFYLIEWIRVRPSYIEERGGLLEPKIIDIKKELIAIFKEFKIPYLDKNNSIYIYGYVKSTENLTY